MSLQVFHALNTWLAISTLNCHRFPPYRSPAKSSPHFDRTAKEKDSLISALLLMNWALFTVVSCSMVPLSSNSNMFNMCGLLRLPGHIVDMKGRDIKLVTHVNVRSYYFSNSMLTFNISVFLNYHLDCVSVRSRSF